MPRELGEGKNQVIDKYYRLQAKDLALFKFILEGYDGLATVTTIERRAASIRVSTTRDFACELEEIIAAARKEYPFSGFESLDRTIFESEG